MFSSNNLTFVKSSLLSSESIGFLPIYACPTAFIAPPCPPNFFKLTERRFTGWRDTDNMRWIYDSIKGYKDFFNGFEFDQSKYINSGFIIFNENHRKLIEGLKELYLNNIDAFINLQDKVCIIQKLQVKFYELSNTNFPC